MPLEVSRDVRPPIQMNQGARAFSRVSTGNSDIPSSCEMEDEHAFKPLQENPTFFRVRAFRGPFHLQQQTQGPSHIPIAERKFFMRCFCEVGLPLQSKTWNQLSSRDDMGCTELSLSCCTEIDVPLDLRWVSQGIPGVC